MNGLRLGFIIAMMCILVAPLAAQESPASAEKTDHVANVKQSLQTSMAALRQYQWVETTVVSVKGDEKSRTQNSCQYGADGKVMKTPMGEPPESSGKKPRGVRGRVAKNKKEEMSDSMKEAVGLVKQYLPPDPERIEAAKQAGKLSVSPPDASGVVHLVIRDYLKEGDSVTIDINAAADQLSGMAVSTFTEKAKDTVGLKVSMGALADGTIYSETIHLDVASQNLGVAIENSGYKKLGG
jgi:hypothetical protein